MGRKINCYPFCRPLLKSTVHYNVGRGFCESSFRFFATQLDVLIIPRLIAWFVPPSRASPLKDYQQRATSMTERLNHQQKDIVTLMKHKPILIPHLSTSLLTFRFFEAKKWHLLGKFINPGHGLAAAGLGCHCGKPRGDLQIHGCRRLWKAPFSERFWTVKWASSQGG